jgi:elongation factor G
MAGNKPKGPRSIALIGPYLSGKTSLLESMLHICGATHRRGSVTEKNSVGDSSAEARERQMSVEVNAATFNFMDDSFTVLDCPGSIEFLQETLNALVGVDAAVVVCEPDPDRALALAPLLKFLADQNIPHFIFVNKIDKARGRIQDLLAALQANSQKPLVLRHLPIRGDGADERITGYVDLALDRAYVYRPNAPSQVVQLPRALAETKQRARTELLEKLADFDDHLMEELLSDVTPPREEICADLAKDLQDGLIVPVLLGAGQTDHGVRRLLKALRHEVPEAGLAAMRAGVDAADRAFVGQVLKTYITAHGGKLSLTRIWSGAIKDGATLNGDRVGGVLRLLGAESQKLGEARAGDIVALARIEHARTGDTLREGRGEGDACARAVQLPPVYSLALRAVNRNDEVKLSGAIAKLTDEDPSLAIEHQAEAHQMVLWGQGEIHLRVAMSRLKNKYGLAVDGSRPRVAYKEAIRRAVSQHGRHKRQSGGHGQFGDVYIDIKPLPRGGGFTFESKIVGGSVPRQYVPAVEDGVREYLAAGPLGFPVVDVAVTLTDGSYHTVDSSEMAFKTAARIAMSEGMPKCDPVLLEPIVHVEVMAPAEFTAKINALVSGRRGQILGFESRPGWVGWETVIANMPQSEMHDLIIELRSLTQGVGTYTWRYDHLQELTGRLADQVLAAARAAAA